MIMDKKSIIIAALDLHLIICALQANVTCSNAGVLHLDVVRRTRPDSEHRVSPKIELIFAKFRNNRGRHFVWIYS